MPPGEATGAVIRSACQSVRQVQESMARLKVRLASEGHDEVTEYHAALDSAAGLLAQLNELLEAEQDSIVDPAPS